MKGILALLTVGSFGLNGISSLESAPDSMTRERAHTTIHTYRGEVVGDLLSTIRSWAVSNYISFPFLYVDQGEELPHHIFRDDPHAFVLFAERNGHKVGMFTALPLTSPLLDVNYSPLPYMDQIREQGFNPDQILYVASFLISKEERQDKGLILRIYQQAVDLAKEMGKTQICYFTALYDDHHPLKPDPFVQPEPWDDLPSPFRSMGVAMDFTWPTLQADGSVKECVHPQALYIQDI